MEKAKGRKKDITIKMSKRQLRANMIFKGGFLGMLAYLAARAMPTLLAGLASGLISGAVEKAVGGNGIYLQKGKHCIRANLNEKGDGMFLVKQPRRIPNVGDGLWLRHGQNVYDGKGLLLGRNSPFRNIPILGWFL